MREYATAKKEQNRTEPNVPPKQPRTTQPRRLGADGASPRCVLTEEYATEKGTGFEGRHAQAKRWPVRHS